MRKRTQVPVAPRADSRQWYDLFSRGARDWLRHNDKVRKAVHSQLPKLVADLDVQGGDEHRTLRVPVRFLEHYRFALRAPDERQGVGQGDVQPGSVFQTIPSGQDGEAKGPGSGSGEGGLEFVLELKVSDIVDWVWEELRLPDLQARSGTMEEDELERQGWDRHGARARLDRRRTLKEAIKRRAVQGPGPAIVNDDLRFRQLVKRPRPATQAAVIYALDASSSMAERDRQLAKSFCFWSLQGLRRQYRHIESVFVAHTVKAWEFNEQEFFKVTGQGGTVASTAFELTRRIVAERYDPQRFNLYLFYASDGENFLEDHGPALSALTRIAPDFNFIGYLEVLRPPAPPRTTPTREIFDALGRHGFPVASYRLLENEDIWGAIRAFFSRDATPAETASSP